MAGYTIEDLVRAAEELWPTAYAEAWDRPGLTVGNPSAPVSQVLLAVDATLATVTEAIDSQASMLLTHHPLLLKGVHSVAASTAKGAMITRLIEHGCAHFSAHTNADVVNDGVSAALARALSLSDPEPIVFTNVSDNSIGLGRIGTLPQNMSLRAFASALASILPPTVTGVRVSGDAERQVSRVAILGGAGDSLLDNEKVSHADVYVTSDLRHHPAIEAKDNAIISGGPSLIDISHWASESLWLLTAAQQLRERLPGLEVRVSEANTDAWNFSVGAKSTSV